MICKCGHQPWNHGWVTYPKHRQPCEVCVMCGQTSRDCCITPSRCRCANFEAKEAEPSNRWVEDMEAGAIG